VESIRLQFGSMLKPFLRHLKRPFLLDNRR
jgi:hypothetical protein